jgi:hypothetical protein
MSLTSPKHWVAALAALLVGLWAAAIVTTSLTNPMGSAWFAIPFGIFALAAFAVAAACATGHWPWQRS